MRRVLGTCSRPTAVNLADACTKLDAVATAAATAVSASASSVVEAVVAAAEKYFTDDIATCKVGWRMNKEVDEGIWTCSKGNIVI